MNKKRKEKFENAIEKIEGGKILLEEAISLFKEAVKLTDDRNAEAYLVEQLEIFASENHRFISGNMNCDTWIKNLKEEIEEEIEEEE